MSVEPVYARLGPVVDGNAADVAGPRPIHVGHNATLPRAVGTVHGSLHPGTEACSECGAVLRCATNGWGSVFVTEAATGLPHRCEVLDAR